MGWRRPKMKGLILIDVYVNVNQGIDSLAKALGRQPRTPCSRLDVSEQRLGLFFVDFEFVQVALQIGHLLHQFGFVLSDDL